MLQRVTTIALNTYRESVRARILLGLAGVAFAVAIASLFIGAWTLKNAPRVVADLGSATISMFAIVVAVVIAATSLHRELEQKTIFPILARPIRRGEYIVGKYLGTLLTIFVFVAADTGLVLMLSAALGGRSIGLVAAVGFGIVAVLTVAAIRSAKARTFGLIPFAIAMLIAGAALSGVAGDERRVVLTASLLCLFEVAIITAVAMLFASFSTPFLSALLTLWVVVIGRSADILPRLPKKLFGEELARSGAILAKMVPNLQVYVPARTLLTGQAADADIGRYLLLAGGTSIAWSIGFLTLATFVFKKRDFL